MKLQTTIAILLLFSLSCTKKEDPDWVGTNTQLLTAGTWQFSYYSFYGGIPTVHLTYADLPSCEQDDYRKFNADGTGEYNQGPTKCNQAAPQSTGVQWRFLNKYATQIEISGTEYYIDKLDAHEFRFHKATHDPYANEEAFGYSH